MSDGLATTYTYVTIDVFDRPLEFSGVENATYILANKNEQIPKKEAEPKEKPKISSAKYLQFTVNNPPEKYLRFRVTELEPKDQNKLMIFYVNN